MKAIEIMNEEHKYILRMLKVVRKACLNIMNEEEIIYEDFDKIIDFIRNYSDKHHLINSNEKAADILMSLGMGCLGCPSATMESLEQACIVHGLDIDEVLNKLNNN